MTSPLAKLDVLFAYPFNQISPDCINPSGGERVRTDDLPAWKAGRSCRCHGYLPSPPRLFGGGERVRTDDLLRARQALSQLSYTPNSITDLRFKISGFNYLKFRYLKAKFVVVGLDGVEPSTSRLSGVRSNQAELQAPSISDCGFWISNCSYLIQSKIWIKKSKIRLSLSSY